MKALKDLSVRWLAYSFLFTATVTHADALSELLSTNKKILFDYDLNLTQQRGASLEKSWINPIMLRYGRNYTLQFDEQRIGTTSFSVSIDQPIFRSGGIYFGIKYARAQTRANELEILQAKRQTIINAATLLYQIHIAKLELAKLELLIKNDQLDIAQKKEAYEAGLLESGFLDQAILKKNQDELKQNELTMHLADLKEQFGLLSDKDPERIKVPKLKLITKKKLKDKSLALQKSRYRVKEKDYFAKMKRAAYLPTISVNGRYIDEDLNPLFGRFGGIRQEYYTYGITLSMPIDFTMGYDLEAAKLDTLKAQTQLLEESRALELFYEKVLARLKVVDRKIALANKDHRLYRRLYRHTRDLVKTGDKSDIDAQVMRNAMRIREIDVQIYRIEKQIELLKLYAKVHDAL